MDDVDDDPGVKWFEVRDLSDDKFLAHLKALTILECDQTVRRKWPDLKAYGIKRVTVAEVMGSGVMHWTTHYAMVYGQ